MLHQVVCVIVHWKAEEHVGREESSLTFFLIVTEYVKHLVVELVLGFPLA